LKIYSEEKSERRISWTHQSFDNVRDLDSKILRASKTLVSEVYAGCNGPRRVHTRAVMGQGAYTRGLYEDRTRTVDRMVKTYV
jgi:hypothetical protein